MTGHTIPTIMIILGIFLIGYAISLVYEKRRNKETKKRSLTIDKIFYVLLGITMSALMVSFTSLIK